MYFLAHLEKNQKEFQDTYRKIKNNLAIKSYLMKNQYFAKVDHSKDIDNQFLSQIFSLILLASYWPDGFDKTITVKSISRNLSKFKQFLLGLNLSRTIDWSRGRFKGDVISIKLKNGLIHEKTFVSPRGGILRVKRSDLGIYFINSKRNF